MLQVGLLMLILAPPCLKICNAKKKDVLRVACCTHQHKTLVFRVNKNTNKGKYATKSDPFIGKTCKKRARLNTIYLLAFVDGG